MTNDMILVVGLGILALILILGLLARMYRKAGPNEALIVYGFRGPRVIKGHGTVIFPMVENCRELSLELMSFDVAPQQDLYTKQGVALIRLVMEGHLRGIIGQLTVEQIVKEPEMVGDRMRGTCADDMSKMGLEVISFTIKEVRDKNEYISNMGRPDIARIKRDAEMATADAERDTAIKRATALRESAVAKAQADQERVIAETASQTRQAEASRAAVSRQAPTRRTNCRPT
jgi:flotillin